jgi:gluconolactonase
MSESVLIDGLDLPEGPAVDVDGNFYCSEVMAGQITRVDGGRAGGKREIFSVTGGGSNGTAFGPDGCLYVMNNGGRTWGDGDHQLVRVPDNPGGSVERIDRSGNVEQIYTECDGTPLDAPNDIVFDDQGNFYFTDTRGRFGAEAGMVYFASMDGRSIRRIMEGIPYPNGIALTDDGSTLIVGQTRPGRLLASSIKSPGEIGPRSVYAKMPDDAHTDGMAFDSAGWLLVTSPNSPQIAVFDENAKYVESITTEDPHTTNVVFGGPDFSTLYVTESSRGRGRVVTMPWRRPGMRLHGQR